MGSCRIRKHNAVKLLTIIFKHFLAFEMYIKLKGPSLQKESWFKGMG